MYSRPESAAYSRVVGFDFGVGKGWFGGPPDFLETSISIVAQTSAGQCWCLFLGFDLGSPCL